MADFQVLWTETAKLDLTGISVVDTTFARSSTSQKRRIQPTICSACAGLRKF